MKDETSQNVENIIKNFQQKFCLESIIPDLESQNEVCDYIRLVLDAQIEVHKEEEKIADERWKRAERHHREELETEMEVCTHELGRMICDLKKK